MACQYLQLADEWLHPLCTVQRNVRLSVKYHHGISAGQKWQGPAARPTSGMFQTHTRYLSSPLSATSHQCVGM